MKIDNFYFVVEDIKKSIKFYSLLLEKHLVILQKIDGLIGEMKIIKYILE